MRQEPDAEPDEQLHGRPQPVDPVQERDVLADRPGPVEPQPTGDRGVVRRGVGVVDRRVDEELPAVVGDGALDLPLQRGEPPLGQRQPLVGQVGVQVRVEQLVRPGVGGRRHQPDRRPDHDRELPEAAQHGLEQRPVAGRRAADQLAPAGDDLEREHVVDLHADPLGGAADATRVERAADGEVEVVGEHRRGQPVCERRPGQVDPEHAGVRGDPVGPDLVHLVERRGVDDHAGVHLGLTVGAVPLAAHGDRDAVPVRVAHQGDDVVDRARPQYGQRGAVHQVAEVVGGGRERGRIGAELAIQVGHRNRAARRALGRLGRRHPAATQRVEGDDRRPGQRGAQKPTAVEREGHQAPPGASGRENAS